MKLLLLLLIAGWVRVEGRVVAEDDEYARGFVKDMINKERTKALQSAKNTDTMVRNAERSMTTKERQQRENHNAVEFRQRDVNRLKAALSNLEYEKKQAEIAKDVALRSAQELANLEESLAVQLADVQKKAGEMMATARAISEEAARARSAADAAAQQGGSTDFIPAGQQQTRVTLVQHAVMLEQRAANSMREAKKHQDIMFEMAQKSTAAWLASSKANEDLEVKRAVYKAKCDAYDNTQAAYNKAQMELRAAESKYNTRSRAVDTAKQDLETMRKRARNFRAVNRAFDTVYICADTGGRRSPGERQRGGSSSGQRRTGGSSSGQRRTGGNSSGQRRTGGSSSGERGTYGGQRNRGGSSEERGNGRVQVQRITVPYRAQRLPVVNRVSGSSSEEHSNRRVPNHQRYTPPKKQAHTYQYPKQYSRPVPNPIQYYTAKPKPAYPKYYYPGPRRISTSRSYYNNNSRRRVIRRRYGSSDEDD